MVSVKFVVFFIVTMTLWFSVVQPDKVSDKNNIKSMIIAYVFLNGSSPCIEFDKLRIGYDVDLFNIFFSFDLKEIKVLLQNLEIIVETK